MWLKFIVLILIFIVGELVVNYSLFRYFKKYFFIQEFKENAKPFLGFDISTFKGMLERLVLFIALILNLSQILIVFGALKIGSRFDKSQKVLNDYFIIGNFTSILILTFP